jgi:hypothetical protein
MALIKGKQIAANSVALNRLPKQDSGKVLVGQGALTDIEFKALSGDASIDATGALTIADNAITESKIASEAISNDKIQMGAVSFAKLADGAVGTSKLAAGAVTDQNMADLSVSAAKLQNSSVTTDKIANTAVTKAKLNADVWSDAVNLSDDAKLPTSLAVKQYISDNTTNLASTDDLPEGVNNLYFTELAAQSAAVQNDLTASIVKAPSVDAIVSYVDGKFETAVQGLDFHAACQTASSANVNIAAPGATINGFTFTANGQRVLLKDQTEPKENGIYDWNGAAAALTRSADSDNSPDGSEVTGGMLTFIEAGNLAGTSWVLNTPAGGVVIGTDELQFVQFSSGAAYVAGNGISVSGLTIALDLSDLADVDSLAKEDKLSLVDATDSSNKLVSVSDLATFLADGTTVTASNGKLTSTATGGSLKRDLSTTPTAVAANATGSTGLTISSTPSSDGHVQVFINGLLYNLGAATNSEVFFSDDAGVTAKTIENIASGDTLFFAGSTCGHALEIDDVIQIVYQA